MSKIFNKKMETAAKKATIKMISDVHLGWHRSNAESFEGFLKDLINKPPDYFVIAGDFIDLWRAEFNEVIKKYKNIFSLLKILGAKGTKIRYVLGNHDYQVRKHIDYFDDFPNLEIIGEHLVINEYVFIHGHQFDILLRYITFLYPFIGSVYRKIYKILTHFFYS